jgi:hypothetical protein
LQELLQTQNFGGIVHPFLDLSFGDMTQLEAKGHIVVDGHVRVQGIVLEDHGDVAIFGVDPIDNALTDFDVTFAGLL